MDFIENYLNYAKENEAPEIFHRWAAIFTLSSIIGRRVWIDPGNFTIYPNLYIIFVGDPGNGKSTAMIISRRMTRAFKWVPLASPSMTLQSITQEMGKEDGPSRIKFRDGDMIREYTQMTFFCNELVTLLNAGGNPIGMVEFFTDIWDEEVFEVKTKNKGCDLIPAPYVNMLGCMTPEITGNMLKQQVISGGFARRAIFVYSDRVGTPVPRPQVTPEMDQSFKKCLEYGKIIGEKCGQFKWDAEAMEFFDEWYKKKHYELSRHTDPVIRGHYRTKDSLVLKVGMLICLSRNEPLVLKQTHLEEALNLLDKTEENLTKVFEGTGTNRLAELASKIIRVVEENRTWVPAKRIYLDLYNLGDRDDIGKAIHHLIMTDRLVEFRQTKGGVEIVLLGLPSYANPA